MDSRLRGNDRALGGRCQPCELPALAEAGAGVHVSPTPSSDFDDALDPGSGESYQGYARIWFDIYAELGYNCGLNRHESNEKREVGCSSGEIIRMALCI
jgi:hypothetical protein